MLPNGRLPPPEQLKRKIVLKGTYAEVWLGAWSLGGTHLQRCGLGAWSLGSCMHAGGVVVAMFGVPCSG